MRTKDERGLTGGQEKDRLLLGFLNANAPYEDIKHALLDFKRRRLRAARSAAERQEIRRGIAEDLLSLSFRKKALAREFLSNLRRVQRLGHSNLALRVHATCMFVQSLPCFPEKTQDAWAMLLDTERRVRRIRKGHPLRQESTLDLAHAKREVGWNLSPQEESLLRRSIARRK